MENKSLGVNAPDEKAVGTNAVPQTASADFGTVTPIVPGSIPAPLNAQQLQSPASSATSGAPVSAVPPQDSKNKINFKKFGKIGAIVVLVLLIIGGVAAVANSVGQRKNANASLTSADRFSTQQISLNDLNSSDIPNLIGTRSLVINGPLVANDAFVISPSLQPSKASPGQLYYDKNDNELAYYNGTQFVKLTSGVESLGGQSGAFTVGQGLNVTNNQINNTGVLTIQGQAGNVTLVAGPGIAIDGTTISATGGGVSSIGGKSGDITLGSGLSIDNSNNLKNAGIISAAAGAGINVVNDGNGNITISTDGQPGTGTVTSPGGTVGRIAKFTGAQDISDSLISESGTTITVSGDLSVTGSLTLGTALSVGNGGTGTTALAANGVVIGNGAGALTAVAAGSSGLCFMSTAGAPAFQACPGGGTVTSLNGLSGALTIADASGAGSTITINDASTTQKGIAQFNGTNFSDNGAGTINTIQNINSAATPTFAGVNTNSINPSGPLTVGSTAQLFTLQGNASSVINATAGVNSTTVAFQSPTANVTYRFATAAAGTYDICTMIGNCAGAGGGVTTAGGITGTLPVFTGSQAIGDSLVSQSGGTVTVNGNLNLTAGNTYQINGAQISSANLSNDSNLAKLNASQTFTGATNTFQNAGNSALAFSIQNAASQRIFSVNTTAGTAVFGQGSALGAQLVLSNATNANTITLVPAVATSNRTITFPDDTGTVCLSTGNCAGAGVTLQSAYNNSTSPEITLDSTRGALTIRDNATPLGANLLEVQNNAGGTTYFAVTSGGTSTTGTSTTSGNINSTGGALQTNSVSRVDNSGNLTNIGNLTLSGAISGGTTYSGSGNINTTGGALQTAGTSRVDNGGNLVNIGNLTASGALTIASSGAGNDVTIDGADQFIVQDAAVFNSTATFNTDVDLTLADTENLNITNTVTGTNALNLIGAVLTNNTTSGTQQVALLQNASGSGTTEGLLVLDNADADTAVTNGVQITSAAGGITTAVDVSDPDIVTALLFGANDITGTNFSVTGGTGSFTSAGNATIQGGTVTVGTTSQQGVLTLHDGNGQTATLSVGSALAANTSIAIPTGVGANDTICLLSLANCVGTGGGVSGSGTNNKLSKFTSTGSTIGDSTITDDGTTVTTSVDLVVQGGDLTVGVANSQTGSLFFKHSGSAFTGTVVQGALTGDRTYTLPDVSGTICTSAGNCSGTGSSNTLQAAYDAGNTISTTDARDIAFTLANTTVDSNFTVTTATGSTSFVSFTRADGAGTADPAQLLLIKNNDVDRAQPVGISLQSAAGGLTTAIDASGSNITNALKVGANAITGTTGSITYTNFGINGSTGDITTAGDFAVNGGDITSTGALTLTSGGSSNIALNSAGTIELQDNTNVTGALAVTSNINSSSGALQTNGTTRVDNSGNLTNIGSLSLSGSISGGTTYSGSGNINTTGGALQTNSTTRVDNSGNLTNIGNITGSGAITIASSGAGNDVTIDGADQFIVQDASVFNGQATFNTDVDLTLADTENLNITNTVTGANSVDLIAAILTNNSTSGTQNIAKLQNAAGSGTTEGLLVLDNADTDTAVTSGLLVSSAAGGVTTALDVSDPDIVTALLFGANDITGTNFSVTGGTGSFTSAGNGTIQGGTVSVGTTSQAGALVLSDGSSNTGTLQVASLASDRVYTLPDATGTICLSTGNCAGAGVTLQSAYNNSTNPEIVLDATRGALTLRDNATPIGANLFEVQNNAGGTTYFGVTSTGTTVTGTLTSSGGTVSLNDSSNNNTNVNTGTSTGAVSIGNGAAGALTLQSGSTIGITTTNFSVSTAGVVTLAGNQTTDITTAGAATASAIILQPGASSGGSSNGAATTIKGGDGSGTTTVVGGALTLQGGSATGGSGSRTGGNVAIDAGTGATANGTINIGTTVSSTINVGMTTGSGAINIGRSNGTYTLSLAGTTPSSTNTQTVNIASAASGQSSGSTINVNVLSGGAGSNGTATLSLGNYDRVTQVDIGNIVADAARTLNVFTGNSTTIDTINIGTGNTTAAGGKTVHIGDGTPTGSGSNLITLGSTALASATTIQSGTGHITLQAAGSGTTDLVQIGTGGAGSATPDYLALDVKSTTGDPAGGVEGEMYYNTFDNKFRCFQDTGWADCITNSASITLQTAYNAGNTIAATDARDIALTLADTTTDPNFTITTATGSTGFTSILRADGVGAADPAQLLLVKNNDTDRVQPLGISVQAAAGGITTAFDASGSNITNALAIGAHAITGTNFSVTGAGAVTAVGVNAGSGLLQGTGGLTLTGAVSLNTTGTANTAIGNATGTFALTSSGMNISTAGDITLGENANHTLSVATRASNAAGRSFTIQSGNAGAGGSAFDGGGLTLQSGSAAGTGNADGGTVLIQSGDGVGVGSPGQVIVKAGAGSDDTFFQVQKSDGSPQLLVNNNVSGGSALYLGGTVSNTSYDITFSNDRIAGSRSIGVDDSTAGQGDGRSLVLHAASSSDTDANGGSVILTAGDKNGAGTVGKVLVQNTADALNAFQVQNAAGTETMFNVDTTARSGSGGNLVKIGNSTGTDTALTILKLDSATADPTSNLAALNGGMFYNSTTHKVSLVENGQVKVICNTTDLGCGTGTVTLQSAYGNGSTISTTGNDIGFTLNSSQNFTVATAAGATGGTVFSLTDGSNATPPAQLVLVKNNDINQALATGISVQSAAGGITTAFDASGSNITNALAIGAHAITGTNFSVTGAGAVTAVGVNSGTGLMQGTGGLTVSGAAVSLNNNSNNNTSINTGTSSGTVTIGGGSAPLVIDSTNFDVSSAGAVSGVTTLSTSGIITAGALGANTGSTSICRNSSNQISSCSGAGGTDAAVTLQNAYANGNSISTTDARDISLTLADTTTDGNLTITTATGSTGFTSILRADGAGTADPAQLLLVKNNDTDRVQPLGISVQAAAGGITTAFDASGSNITNALALGAHAITGTNFSVTGAGAVTAVGVNSGSGLIQGTGGLTVTGTINLGSVGTSTAASTIHVADTTDATGTQLVTIGSTAKTANTTTIQGNTILLQSNSSTGAVTIKSGTNSANAFQVQDSGSNALLSADSSTNAVRFGTSSAGLGSLFFNTVTGTDTAFFMQSGAALSSSNLQYAMMKRANNKDLLFYGYDGTSFWNYLQLDGTNTAVTLQSNGSGNISLLAGGNVTVGTSDTTGTLLVLDTKTGSGDPTGVDGAMYYNSNMAMMRCYYDGGWHFCNDPVSLTWGYNIDEEFVTPSSGREGTYDWTEIVNGTGAQIFSAIATDTKRPGVIELDTGTEANANAFATTEMGDNDDADEPILLGGGEVVEMAVKLGALSTAAQEYDARLGLCDQSNNDCVDGVYFEYNRNNSTNWSLVTANSSTRTRIQNSNAGCTAGSGSSVAVASGSWIRFKIVMNSNASQANYYINGTFVGCVTTNIPTARATSPYFSIQKDGTGISRNTMDVDYFQLRNSYTTQR